MQNDPAAQGIGRQLSTWFADEFRPAVLATSLLSGLLIYVFEIIVVISFAALIFPGKLADQMPQALGFIILGDAILIAAIALLSSYPGMIGASQDAPAAIMGLIAMQIAALPVSEAQRYATVVMMIVVTTLMTGALFLALGIFKLGSLARYFPYPVMGGFLAGTGWLLARGGVETMVSAPFGPLWFDAQVLLRWLPGTILGVMILLILARYRQPVILPVLLTLGILLFYVAAGVLNVSPAELEAGGWLVGALPSGGSVQLPLSVNTLSQVDWTMLWRQMPNIAPAAIISVIALLLNSGGLELVIKRDINLSRELFAAGAGNLAAGMLGGLTGYHAISFSALNHKMSGGKRMVGLVAALLLVLTIFLGTSVLSYIPNMILGAVLVYLGASLLVEWVYEAWFKFPKIDFLIIVSILGVIMLSSFLNGVILGLVLATILFVVSYSNISVIKHTLSGEEYHSRVTRGSKQMQLLEAKGDRITILKLQGFLFFGTANSIIHNVRERTPSRPSQDLHYFLLDFTQVSGLDSTALLSFRRMLNLCQEKKIVFVLTGLREQVHAQFARGGFMDQPDCLRFFPDLDHGVEWCEDEIIAQSSMGKPEPGDFEVDHLITDNLLRELKAIAGEQSDVERLLPYLQRQDYAAGETLIRQGDDPDTIYLIGSGQVTAQLESPGHAPMRLETMGGGRTVGELGFYLGIKRTAAVIVDEPSVIYSLSRQALANMEKRDPETANLFHRIIVHLLGERVVHLTRIVDAMER